MVGIKEEIKDNASGHITVMKHIFKDELYKNSHIIRDQMKTQIANWNYKQADSLVAQADEILQIKNDDGDHDKVDTNKRSIHEISDSPHKHEQYQIPETFDTFQKLLEHYYNDAEPYEKEGGGTKWRRHLTLADKKRFTRMKRIMNAFRKKLLDEDVDKVTEDFETFYTSNNRSFAKLADVYAKKINKC